MTIHRVLVLTTVATLYYGLSWYALYAFEAGILLTALMLFGIPAYLLARFSSAPTMLLISVAFFGVGLSILLEGIAHRYGLWYTVGVDGIRLFGLVPVEAAVAMCLQVVFFALLYEVLFDDGQYTERGMNLRFLSFALFALIVGGMVGLESVMDTQLIQHPYWWLISVLLLASLVSLAAYRSLTIRFLKRLWYVVALAIVPVTIATSLAITNTHKVFANLAEYSLTYRFSWGQLPFEEVVLALTLPLVVATIYEIYLDDIE